MKSKLQFILHSTRRAASTARRRPRAAGFVAICVSVFGIAGAGEALTSPPSNIRATSSDTAAQPADLDSLFDARSPGSRRYGALVNTKQPRTGFDVGPPNERVLSSTRRHPGPPVVPGDTPAAPYAGIEGPFGTPAGSPTDIALLDDAVPTGTGGAFVSAGPVIGGILPSGGNGSSGGSPGDGGPGTGGLPGSEQTDTPLPAVPEPTTWAMLVLGFFAIGATMRRRRPDLQLHEAR
jgi:hypothetical protein